MKLSSIFLMLLFLCSCDQGGNGLGDDKGGGASGGGSSRSTMDDLDVSHDFDFIGGETLSITIADVGSSTERRYLNICSQFSEVNGEFSVSYDSCLLRTSIQGSNSGFDITISSSQQKLIAQVWPLNNGARPVNYHWSKSEDGNDWKITVF